MKNLLLLFFLFISFQGETQNQAWDLFLYGHPTYYKTQDNVVNCYFASEIEDNGMTTSHFFLRKEYLEFGCAAAIADYASTSLTKNIKLREHPMHKDANGMWYAENGMDSLWFNPLSAIGETVVSYVQHPDFDAIEFTCTDLSVKPFLDTQDNVRTFEIAIFKDGFSLNTPLVDFDFQLSENHGFLAFSPFQLLLQGDFAEKWEIAGIEKDANRHGFTNSVFDYTANYKMGDVFYSKEYDHSQRPTFYCRKDSITDVNKDASGVFLSVERTDDYYTDGWGHFSDSLMSRRVHDTILQFTVQEFNAYFTPYMTNSWEPDPTYGYWQTQVKIDTNGHYDMRRFIDGFSVNPTTCEFEGWAEICHTRKMNSSTGLTYFWKGGCISYFGPSYRLTGYTDVLDGLIFGLESCGAFTSSIDVAYRETMNIYPNPASEGVIHFDFSDKDLALSNVEIYNTNGKLVLEKNKIKSNETLDVSALSNGLYFVKIMDAEQRSFVSKLSVVR